MRTTPRLVVALVSIAVLAGAAGCNRSTGPQTDASPDAGDDLQVQLNASRRVAEVGDTVHLTVTARNTSWSALTVESATAAEIVATLWRYDSLKGWVRCKMFPTASYQQPQKWTLDGGKSRTFTMDLIVEPDWPVLETLKLTTELNGRPDVRPFVFVYVQPKS